MTPYAQVFESFLTRIEDVLWARSPDQQVIEQDLLNLMNIAIPRIRIHSDAIKNRDDSQGLFGGDLIDQEIDTIASYMKLEWVSRQLTSWEKLQLKVIDRDTSMKAQSSHINAIRNLVTQLRTEAKIVQDQMERFWNHECTWVASMTSKRRRN